MFANYYYSNFPEVKVTFEGTIKDKSDFTLFIDQWKELYNDKREFTFLFDMEGMGIVNPKYCFSMAEFIEELKQEPIQYLQKSTFINTNTFIRGLLKIIFAIQSPVAPVEIKTD